MASKTIEQDNDRRLTIMTATFVPCGAKLPVYRSDGRRYGCYMSGDMDLATMMAPIMYFVGIAAVLVSAIMFKEDQTVLRQTSSVRYGASGVPHILR